MSQAEEFFQQVPAFTAAFKHLRNRGWFTRVDLGTAESQGVPFHLTLTIEGRVWKKADAEPKPGLRMLVDVDQLLANVKALLQRRDVRMVNHHVQVEEHAERGQVRHSLKLFVQFRKVRKR